MRYLIRIALALAVLIGGQACRHNSTARAPTRTDGISESAELQNRYAFKCGTNVCDARISYCEMIKTDVPKLPSDFACKPLPPACRPNAQGEMPNCDCFPAKTRCAFCSKIENNGVNHFQRTCIGGY